MTMPIVPSGWDGSDADAIDIKCDSSHFPPPPYGTPISRGVVTRR